MVESRFDVNDHVSQLLTWLHNHNQLHRVLWLLCLLEAVSQACASLTDHI